MVELLEALQSNDGPLLVVTGAGVSAASGIPLFRGTEPDAVWNRDVTELGTRAFFNAHPAASWRWYLDRFASLMEASPNAAHRAMVSLERFQRDRGADFLLVTQNVDGLHRAAGSDALIEVHGRADRVRCSADKCENAAPRGSLPLPRDAFQALIDAPRDELQEDDVPRCPACGAFVRPHVLWFDERYDEHRDYRFDEVMRGAKRAKTIVYAGTSFAVGVTEAVMSAGLQRQANIFSIDPSGRSPHRRVNVIAEPAETYFPDLITRLNERSE